MSKSTPEQRRAAARRGAETAKRNRQRREEMEMRKKFEQQAQINALRRVWDDPDSSSDAVLRAVELLAEMEK